MGAARRQHVDRSELTGHSAIRCCRLPVPLLRPVPGIQLDRSRARRRSPNIATWGPQDLVNSSLSIPASFPLAVNSSSITSTNSTFQTFVQQVRAQRTAPRVALPTGSAGAAYTYTQQPNAGNSVYSRAQSTIAPATVPLTYPVVYQSNVAPRLGSGAHRLVAAVGRSAGRVD